MQRTDIAITLYYDEEGLYDVLVEHPDGRWVVDPRMVTILHDYEEEE